MIRNESLEQAYITLSGISGERKRKRLRTGLKQTFTHKISHNSYCSGAAVGENLDFQLRFEFYNLFNRVQFTKPDNNIGDVLFGYSTSQVGQNDGTTGARQVQIGAKLNF
ncbi:MAG: hypothetical protein WCA38_05190 [Candidatus Acidiferrales bacterium]